MGRRLTIESHLSLEELEKGYRNAKDAIAKTHYQALWLLKRGKRTKEVAEVTGYSRLWLYELVRSYNREGEAAIGDQRRHNKGGSPPILDDTMQAQLFQALQHEAPDGGQWNGRKVADWLSERLGRSIHRQRGWELLKQMEFNRKKPRPEHINAASEEEQREWEKKAAPADRRGQKSITRRRRRAVGNG